MVYDLSGAAATIAQAITFAAYGEMLAVHNQLAASIALSEARTSLGYSGEHFDAKARQQYLRARFYNPANGRFNRLDPFAGNMQDPQSLHKYSYVHGDPVQGVDPSGEFAISIAIGFAVMSHVQAQKSSGDIGFGAAAIAQVATLGSTVLAAIIEANFEFSVLDQMFRREEERRTLRGNGGKDVTNELLRAARTTQQYWGSLSPTESRSQYLKTIDLDTGWDISPLNENEYGQRIYFSTAGDWARRSVTVSGGSGTSRHAYYAHEVNYFIFGVMAAEAAKKGGPNTRQSMSLWVQGYRLGHGNLKYAWVEHDGLSIGRQWWADAGWDWAMTGEFKPPVKAALPLVNPSTIEYGVPSFEVKIGTWTIPNS